MILLVSFIISQQVYVTIRLIPVPGWCKVVPFLVENNLYFLRIMKGYIYLPKPHDLPTVVLSPLHDSWPVICDTLKMR